MLDLKVPNVNERKCIPFDAIRAVADHIVEKFAPDKIILFGSYAYGEPKPWSDMDLLVVMETPEGSLAQMLTISRSLSPHQFGIDIIVRSPQALADRLAAGDFFLKEIVARGKVLYEIRRSRTKSAGRMRRGVLQ